MQGASSSKPCWAKRQPRQAADPSPCRTSASSHLHPRMLAGEPDPFSWPRSIAANILASESSHRASAARAAFRQIQTSSPGAGEGELMQPMLPMATARPDCPVLGLTLICRAWFVQGNNLCDMALKLQVPFGCTGRSMYAAHHGEESNQIK
jgi:hypothetical protein